MGEEQQQFVVVLHGVIEMRTKKGVATLLRGGALGQEQCMQSKPAKATAIVASGTCKALVLAKSQFLACLEPLLKDAERITISFFASKCPALHGTDRSSPPITAPPLDLNGNTILRLMKFPVLAIGEVVESFSSVP